MDKNIGPLIYNNVVFQIINGILYVGENISTYCVSVSIDKNIAKIIQLKQFNSSCGTIDDTRLMVKILLEFMKVFLNIEKVTLYDNSMVICDQFNYFMIYYMYLFKYGEGYYAKNFGFDFVKDSDKDIHMKNLRKIKHLKIDKKNLEKNIGEYDGFVDGELVSTFLNRKHDCKLLSKLFNFYEQTYMLDNMEFTEYEKIL